MSGGELFCVVLSCLNDLKWILWCMGAIESMWFVLVIKLLVIGILWYMGANGFPVLFDDSIAKYYDMFDD